MLQKKILIYSGYGTSEFCLKQMVKFFKNFDYELISANEIISGILKDDPKKKILCFGGGFDQGYLDSLGPIGCENIKNFVYSGGNYLGICAGAYFACDYIEFDINGPLEVKGARLGFFKGNAIGPINKKFQYNDEDFCHAIKIRTADDEDFFYLNGGPFFESNSNQDYEAIAYYVQPSKDDLLQCDEKLAILKCYYGLGKCLLSGVHIEFDHNDLDIKNQNVRFNVQPKLLNEKSKIFDYLLKTFE